MSRKKLIAIIIVLISFSVLSLIGTTYALFTKTVKGTKKVSITAGTLKIDFEEGNKISLDNIGTLSDEDGRKTEPYRFTITNSGTIASYYNMSLTDESSVEGKELLNTYYLKYELKDNKGNTKEGRIGELYQFVTNQKLEVDDSVTYELRLWLDKDTPNGEQNKGYQSKIVVNGSQMKTESIVTFTYKDKVYQETSKDNVVTISNLDLDSDLDTKVLVCNNGASVQYENNTVTIKDITRDTTCSTYSSLQEVSTKIDDSYNDIVLIKDESYVDTSITFSNKKGTIDLNGHIVTFVPTTSTGHSLVFNAKSNFTLNSSREKGGMFLNVDNTTVKTRILISISNTSIVTIESGYYGSNNTNTSYETVSLGVNTGTEYPVLNIKGKKADHCTSSIDEYNTGLCIYSNQAAAVKNNGGSNSGIINIYGGSFVSNNYAYMTDAPGGETNIYGGYFNGKNYSIGALSDSSDTNINICGGEFDSPTDIFSNAKNSFVYYRNGINWKNGDTPIIGGNYQNNAILKSNLVCE